MRVLVITHKPPFPSVDGGCVAMASSLHLLNKLGYNLHLFSLHTSKHPAPKKSEMPTWFSQEYHRVQTHFNPLMASLDLIRGKSYNLSRFYSARIAKKLKKLVEKNNFDLIFYESLYSLLYIDKLKSWTNAKSIYRSHNIEFNIWKELALEKKNPLLSIYMASLAKSLEKEERMLTEQADYILSISPKDNRHYYNWGLDQVAYLIPPIPIKPAPTKSNSSCYHLGAMDWKPNQEGVNWFIEKVYPLLPNSEIDIHFAGKNMSDNLMQLTLTGLNFHGEVASAAEFIQDKSICLVPLFSGSGVRIKVLEAISAGKCLISTSKGIEGLGLKHKKEVLIADKPEDFAKAILQLSTDASLRFHIANNAYQWAKDNLAEETQLKNLSGILNKLLEDAA